MWSVKSEKKIKMKAMNVGTIVHSLKVYNLLNESQVRSLQLRSTPLT